MQLKKQRMFLETIIVFNEYLQCCFFVSYLQREIRILKHFGDHPNIVSLKEVFIAPVKIRFCLKNRTILRFLTSIQQKNHLIVIYNRLFKENKLYKTCTFSVLWFRSFVDFTIFIPTLYSIKFHAVYLQILHGDLKPENILVKSNCDLAVFL